MSTARREVERLEEIPGTGIWDGTVAKSTEAAGFTGVDPRRRRFGYHPGIYRMEMEPSHSGQQQRVLPGGMLIPFRTATLRVENFEIDVDIDEYQKQVPKDFTAKYFIDNCKVNYEVQGFRELEPLTMLDDAIREEGGKLKFENFLKSPHGYFNQLHPSLSELGHICPQGLAECVTCRLSFLQSDEYDGPLPIIQQRMGNCPNPNTAELLRLVLVDANTTYRDFCLQTWAVLIGEYDKRQKGEPGIASFDDSLHHIRKHLHETAPTERAAQAAAGYGAQVAQGQVEGMKELAEAFRERPANSNDEVIKMLAQGQQQLAEGLKQQGEMLAKLVGDGKEKAQKPKEKTPEKTPEQ